jgi:hypothetical protein
VPRRAQRGDEAVECPVVIGRLRVVVAAAGDADKLLRLVGRGEQTLALLERDQLVGVAVADENRAV